MRPTPVQPIHRPRELRRRVLLPARLRTSAGWSDACILNVSSRGLMIHARSYALEGSTIELRHGQHAIVGRVVWRKGGHVGLSAEERVPVEAILTLSQAPALQLIAPWRGAERRSRPRTHDESRIRSRAMEFAGVALIGALLSGGMFVLVEEALARPIAYIAAALVR